MGRKGKGVGETSAMMCESQSLYRRKQSKGVWRRSGCKLGRQLCRQAQENMNYLGKLQWKRNVEAQGTWQEMMFKM